MSSERVFQVFLHHLHGVVYFGKGVKTSVSTDRLNKSKRLYYAKQNMHPVVLMHSTTRNKTSKKQSTPSDPNSTHSEWVSLKWTSYAFTKHTMIMEIEHLFLHVKNKHKFKKKWHYSMWKQDHWELFLPRALRTDKLRYAMMDLEKICK